MLIVWRMYHDSGYMRLVLDSEKEKRLRIENQEDPDRVHCMAFMGWVCRSTTILAGQDWSVKEVACRSTGDPHCEFVITPSA